MDAAPETEGEGGTEKGRGNCCHGERFLKQLLIRLCCSAPLSILLLFRLSLLSVSTSHSGKRFVGYAVGCGPSFFRPFTRFATRRDGTLCHLNTERKYLQVGKDILAMSLFFQHTHKVFTLQCLYGCVCVCVFFPSLTHLTLKPKLCIIRDEPKPLDLYLPFSF